MSKQSLVAVVLIATCAVLVAGCGGPPAVKDVRSCLKDAKLKVENPPSTDKDFKEGVLGMTDLSKLKDGKPEDMVMAIGAIAKNDKAVDKVKKMTSDLAKDLKKSDSTKNLDIESGTSGRYAWVVVGKKDRQQYKDARDCVKA